MNVIMIYPHQQNVQLGSNSSTRLVLKYDVHVALHMEWNSNCSKTERNPMTSFISSFGAALCFLKLDLYILFFCCGVMMKGLYNRSNKKINTRLLLVSQAKKAGELVCIKVYLG